MIEDTFRVGMPETAYSSLSETWLLKTCGQRHWRLVEDALGAPASTLRDSLGRRLYASFVALRLSDAKLAEVEEDAELTIRSRAWFLTPKRTYSLHEGWCGGRLVFRQEMIAVFLKRTQDGANADLASAAPAGFRPAAAADAPAEAAELMERARSARARLPSSRAIPPGACRFTPAPFADFNGAGLLYFASFQSITDRFEFEALGPELGTSRQTAHRELYIFGNLDVGDTVAGAFEMLSVDGRSLDHRLLLQRGSDGRPIAVAITGKRRPGLALVDKPLETDGGATILRPPLESAA